MPAKLNYRFSSMRARSWLLAGLSLPMVSFLLIPCLSLLLRLSPAGFLDSIQSGQVAEAITLSGVTTGIATIITVIAGTPVAYLLARRSFRGKSVVDTFIDLPILIPPSVAGIALLLAFGRRGLAGGVLSDMGIDIPFTQTAVILAQLFVAAPLYIKSARAGFSTVERELEQAAEIDGASPSQRFRLITVPLSIHALAGGTIMTWARALGEFGATIIFAGNFPGKTQTMPLAIYMGFEIDFRIAVTLALILLFLSFLVLLTVRKLLKERLAIL
ncbi:MAG TPA: ABC transporter permease [Bacteroidota bacterium]|jgi:molybdate transport system permease protein